MRAKKLFCILIAAVLAVGMIPVALAEGNDAVIVNTEQEYSTLAAAVSAASAGDTIRMLHSPTYDSSITINKTLSIDLNGQTITLGSNNIQVTGGTLTIMDGKRGGAEGTITSSHVSDPNGGSACGTIHVYSGSSLVVKSGTIQNNARGQAFAIYTNGGTVTVGGGTNKAKVSAVSNGENEAYGIYCAGSDKLTVKKMRSSSQKQLKATPTTSKKQPEYMLKATRLLRWKAGASPRKMRQIVTKTLIGLTVLIA